MAHDLVKGTARVVYIEAGYANAMLVRYLLELKLDSTLHHAADDREGLQLCRQLRPELVLTETNLPDMSAYEVLQVLRTDAATENLPCIVLSGDAMPGSVERAFHAGFDGYWTKPVDAWQLLLRLKRALGIAK